MTKTPMTIDQRIGSALATDADVTAIDLAALIVEVEHTLVEAEQNAAATRKVAMDVIATPDPNKARASIEMATLTVDRLKTALSQLQSHYAERDAEEYAARWSADYATMLSQRDKLAKEFGEVYPEFQNRLIDLLQRIAACDRSISDLHGKAPNGEHRRISTVEQHARQRTNPSIAKLLQLPDWGSTGMAWPPKSSLAAAMFAPVPAHDPRYSSDWHGATDTQSSPITREQQRYEVWHREEERLQDERRRREDLEDLATKRRTA